MGFVELDARELPFPNGAFPLVTCCMALHEMSEPERDRVVREIRRVTSDRVVVADYRELLGTYSGLLGLGLP